MKPMEPFCPLCGSKMNYNSNYKYSCPAYKCPLGVIDLSLEAIEALQEKIDNAYQRGQESMMSGE